MSRQTGSRHWLRLVACVIGAWALLVGLTLLQVLPDVPHTTRGWLLLLVAGPPIYLAGEWLFECVIGPRLPSVSPKRFSFAWFAMMALGVMFGTAVLALLISFSLVYGR